MLSTICTLLALMVATLFLPSLAGATNLNGCETVKDTNGNYYNLVDPTHLADATHYSDYITDADKKAAQADDSGGGDLTATRQSQRQNLTLRCSPAGLASQVPECRVNTTPFRSKRPPVCSPRSTVEWSLDAGPTHHRGGPRKRHCGRSIGHIATTPRDLRRSLYLLALELQRVGNYPKGSSNDRELKSAYYAILLTVATSGWLVTIWL